MSTRRVAFRTLFIVSAFVGGAFAVAACQGTGEPRDAAAGFMASEDSYGVHFIDTGDTAKLAYGEANSEVMSLMLECAKGSGMVEVSDVARGAQRLQLTSGGERTTLTGEIQDAPMAPILFARAKADVPALKGFRQSGRLTVVNGALSYEVAAEPAERAGVEQFFTACELAA